MQKIRIAALAAAICLGASVAVRAADFSVSLSDGATPAAHSVLSNSFSPNNGNRRTSLWIVSADAAGSPSAWCTFKGGIVPGPGVAGSFEIVAGSSGFDRELPGTIPQDVLFCAPLANQVADLTILAVQ